MRPLILIPLLGCASAPNDDTGPPSETEPVTGYDVRYGLVPEGCPVPGETVEFTTEIRDQLGRPVPDLQQSHERMLHTLFVSQDLASFQHLHHEDHYEITADDLRSATFHFPLSLPLGGSYRVVTDYAHQNVYQQNQGWIEACGAPEMAAAPNPTFSTEASVDDTHAALSWTVEPRVGALAQWTVTFTEAEGDDITDVVPWLGADAHAALVSADLAFTGHTHAWTGIDNMAPGMEMQHLYDGPDIAFQATFTQSGVHRMWVQFARSGAPESPITVPFWFEVAP